MAAAIGTLAELSGSASAGPGRCSATCSSSGTSPSRPRDLGTLVANTGIDRLVAVGAYAEPMAAGARAAG